MSEEQTYVNDTRTKCKYGLKCYQKNPEHHKQFQHPPQLKAKITKRNDNRFKPYNKAKKGDVNTKTNKDETENTNTDTDNDVGHKATTTKTESDKDSHTCLSPKVDTEILATGDPPKSENDSKISQSPKADTETELATEDPPKYIIKSDGITFYNKDADLDVLKESFLVEMPDDFFQFFKCLESDTENVEKLLAAVNLQLIGPYELFLGKLPKLEDKSLYLIHWRFFFDPPEYQAVLKKKGKSEFHLGYYRDDPQAKPVFLAKNDSSENCTITPVSENIFGAVYWFLQNEKKTSPFISVPCQKLMDKVKKWAEQYNYSLEEFNMKIRLQQIVCRTFHSAGIVVPYNKKTQLGYRKLVESDGNLKKMFQKLKDSKSKVEKDKILSELQPVITYASIAMDECDFGTGLEAGIALFCSGVTELQNSVLKNLEVAYSLLDREVFTKIIQVHMKYRRKGPNMSVLGND